MGDRKLEMTPAWIEALKPEAQAVEYRDTGQSGLVLRVEKSGRKTWVCRYTIASRDRRYTLGTFPSTSLKDARRRARKALGRAEGGDDPQLDRERLRVGETVDKAITSWLADERQGPAARWKGGIEGGTARCFLPHVKRLQRDLGSRKLGELTARDVEKFASKAEAAATRNRSLTAVRMFWKWAKRKGLVEGDPAASLSKEREPERDRVLNDAELAALVLGFDQTRYGPAVRLLALTALRRDEVLGAEWSWFDADARTLTIPAESEKTGRSRGEARLVALCPAAVELLKAQREEQFRERPGSAFIFATRTGERPHRDALKPIVTRLRKRGELPDDVTIHDVRRTVANALLNRLKVAPWVVDHVVLGHVRPKLLRTYMPELPLEEAREALTRWAEALEVILRERTPPKAGRAACATGYTGGKGTGPLHA